MNKGIRIVNYLTDLLAISIVAGLIVTIFDNQGLIEEIILTLIYFLYYLLFEYFKGQTIGKMITKTIVIDINNLEPSFFKILLRTILRFSYLDIISYLFGLNLGLHDTLSKTKLKVKN
jgi:uncharacterized RDD family membrane protein YckC